MLRNLTRLGLVGSHVALALGLLATAAPTEAAVSTYDLTMNTVAQPLTGAKVKLKVTGTMTWDDVTGEVTFDVDEPGGVNIQGAGLLGNGGKVAIGKVDLQAFAGGLEPVFTGTGFFKGKFTRANTRFNGTFTAVADSFGPAPGGFTYNTGKVSAKRRP